MVLTKHSHSKWFDSAPLSPAATRQLPDNIAPAVQLPHFLWFILDINPTIHLATHFKLQDGNRKLSTMYDVFIVLDCNLI